jgi:geranylgeranyl pyrophosphate synthase
MERSGEDSIKTDKEFANYVQSVREFVDLRLKDLVSQQIALHLYPQLSYSLLSEGKRLRPILGILAAEATNGTREKVANLALAGELIHTASLVHDDIIDDDKFRRGKPTLHLKWSRDDAIVTGDALISLAISLAASYGEEILRTVANAALELCDGELMELKMNLQNSSEEDFFLKTKKKTASAFRVAAQCGAMASGATTSDVEALAKYGEYFGTGFQLRDDLNNLFRGNPVPTDLLKGRLTLPLLHLYQFGSEKVRELLLESFGNSSLGEGGSSKILGELRKSGSISYCENYVKENLVWAKNSIEGLHNSHYKSILVRVAELVLTDGDKLLAQSLQL